MSGADEQTPDRVVAGRYRLESVLGRGGMGVVWLATDTLIERRVALKELRIPADVAAGDEGSFLERALREARSAGRLSHPGVVAVHDVIAPGGDVVYVVMEYVQAPTLAQLLAQRGPLPAPRVAALGVGILDPLMAAHAMGIVHRDVKPANVLVPDGDRVKLTDFGIALAVEDTRLTRSGVIGTHTYLAPECFDAGQIGPATDLWALGATLFHAVAGRAPFERPTTTATLRAILFEEPPAPPCGPPLADAISGLLTRPVDQRLTGDAARELLQRAAAEPITTTPTTSSGSGSAGPATWDARATTVHRPPATPPGPQPPPYGPPPAPPPPGPTSGASWAGSPPPRPNTPWIVGGVVAAAAVLLLLVAVAMSGGGGGSGDDTTTTQVSVPDVDPPGRAVGDPAEGEAAAQEFVDAVNRGDSDAATGMLCSFSDDLVPEVTDAVAGGASLTRGETIAQTELEFMSALTGTIDGTSVISPSSVSLAFHDTPDDTGWCVFSFAVASAGP